MRTLIAFSFAAALLLPLAGIAGELSSQRDYSDPQQRDRPIACKTGDLESFPGKTLGEVFGEAWPVQPLPSAPDAHSSAQVLKLGPMHWPAGLDPQNSVAVVAVLVGADGRPLQAEMLCSTRRGLDAAVRRHAMASSYTPAMVDGQAITSPLVRVAIARAANRAPSPRARRP